MDERPDKARGPIYWLVDTYRADPVRVIVWTLFLLIVPILIVMLLPAFQGVR